MLKQSACWIIFILHSHITQPYYSAMQYEHGILCCKALDAYQPQAAGRSGACAAGAVPALVALLGSTHPGVQVCQRRRALISE